MCNNIKNVSLMQSLTITVSVHTPPTKVSNGRFAAMW